jgi:hypothetical protein
MSRFTVFFNSTPIGHSDLESGDPPMGVASGKFLPLPSYQEAQLSIIAARDNSQDHLALTVRTTDGQVLPAQGGVQIVDHSPELGAEGIELHVLFIGYPLYEELFPGRRNQVHFFRRQGPVPWMIRAKSQSFVRRPYFPR